ncbi:FCD domain-containing protein [Alkalibaculum sp. M08DMB]|uniref:FCD domain-containing protein n=2 Tax=Alkalibaculum sporogenes TaxID=2655001 RepID=A0A6A7K5N5_9FIRM|nr:GntR family transcriptional regulator [Alkalibaculum sporogenes]MPW24728.1 FCD domain-containing protein [Alkalibaculum sporogenes]
MEKEPSKQQLAYEKIKDSIIKNEFLPDTLLVERQLCTNMDISRTPVRDALRRLAGEGLVEFIPDKGMFVSRIRLEDIIEIYELREALESMAVRLFTLRKTEEDLKIMEGCVEQQESSFNKGDYSLSVAKDMEFHEVYIKGAKNLRMENFLRTIHDQTNRVAFSTTNDLERMERSIHQHKEVLEAIKSSDEVLAEELIKKHIIDTREYHMSKFYLIR